MGSIAYKNWECSRCHQNFDTRRQRNGHSCPNKKDYIWVCPYCKLQVSTRANLNSHKKTCNNKPHKWVCSFCKEQFRTRRLLQEHHKSCELAQENNKGRNIIHGNYTIPETKCTFCDRTFTNSSALTLHQKYCNCNPHRAVYKVRHPSEETKRKLSEAMKKAHAEGRAHVWNTRKGVKHSYPENWLISVLKTHLDMVEDVDYVTELPFYGQFLDFAWPTSKVCIEMDGEQHKRWQDRIDLDNRKNENLEKDGWVILRLDWSDVSNNKDLAVETVINFIKTKQLNNDYVQYVKERNEQKEKELVEKQKLIQQGKVNSLGRLSVNKITDEEMNERKNMILNSGVDIFSKGWQAKISQITGLTRHQIAKVIEKTNLPCYRRL